jgi:hypothetical protein
MLQTLEKLDRSRVASVLSLAARKLLPRPGDDHTPNQADQAIAEDLIKELLAKGSASRRPQAEVDTVTAQESLSREISSYLLSGVDSAEVRARVGDKGALSPSLYKVSFSPRFENGVKFWGLSKNHVLNAIANCDQVQHFISKVEAPNAPAHGSLFTQIPPVKHSHYTTLVKCQRAGAMLVVDEAYRVYHDEVDLLGVTSPLDILKRFIEKFGEEVKIKVLNADQINTQPSERGKLFHEVVYNVPRGGFLVGNFPNGEVLRIASSEDAPFEVALCFAVSYQKYVDQLMRHGVKAEIPQHMSAFTVRNVKPVP